MKKVLEVMPKLVPASARFGAQRKFDIHCGIDLHCSEGAKVFALEDGVVKKVALFTGPQVNSPWWEETMYVGVLSSSGYIVYGEITPEVKEGDKVRAGDILGAVKKVLKKNKGAPTAMLHLELYREFVEEPVEWKLNQVKPEKLENVETLFKNSTLQFEA